LFSVDHVPDIVGTSGAAPSVGMMTKQEIVVALNDTSVMLDERKTQFELMIHSLEREREREREDAATEDEQEESEEEKDGDAGNDYEETSKSRYEAVE